jgi:D-beta-D-heptose 7-phosphate kinase/D-beta-D-heptose 1-phosphate adenosyltransferase
MLDFHHPERIHAALAAGFSPRPLLVVGDLMLDRYLWGRVERISPEAPVPVLHLQRQTEAAGGAANVALNLAGLGARVVLGGSTGSDPEGERLLELLRAAGVSTGPVLRLQGHPTTTKTRVIGQHQQMLRIDRELVQPLEDAEQARLLETLQPYVEAPAERLPAALVLSDYAKGGLAPALCRALIRRARSRGIPVLVDPKGKDYGAYRGATLISPNRAELAAAGGAAADDIEGLLAVGRQVRADLRLDYLLLTLGEQGMALVGEGSETRIPAHARDVYDVSGAGDTVIATLAAGLAAGLKMRDAARLANLAASVVVGKVGTTPVDAQELRQALDSEQALEQSHKIRSPSQALAAVTQWRARGERIVFTNGCFDLLHAGHVAYLEQARRLGGRLVVGLNSDASVTRLKGPERPLMGEGDRARVLAALAAVDAVVVFGEPTPLRLIEALRPDVLVKGADYREDQVVGAAQVKAWGGRVVLLPLLDGRSTTGLIKGLSNPARG